MNKLLGVLLLIGLSLSGCSKSAAKEFDYGPGIGEEMKEGEVQAESSDDKMDPKDFDPSVQDVRATS